MKKETLQFILQKHTGSSGLLLSGTKMKYVEDIDKFLDTYGLQKFDHEKTEKHTE
jgi:hypothetical protein